MNDYIYIPKHVAQLLLQGQASWDDVESLVSLLTIAALREPVEEFKGFSRYIVKTEELKARFRASANLGLFSFSFKNTSIPYIHDLVISKPPNKTIDYKVHDLCNPKYYTSRYKKNVVFDVFPVSMWRMPRHILIRWRYSSKLPVHKSSFAKPIKVDDWIKLGVPKIFIGSQITDLASAVAEFKVLSNHFYYIMSDTDESSVSYSFICHVFFFAQDCLVNFIKRDVLEPGFFAFLKRLRTCFESMRLIDMPPSVRISKIEGMLRGILPHSFYTKSQHSKYCGEAFRAAKDNETSR